MQTRTFQISETTNLIIIEFGALPPEKNNIKGVPMEIVSVAPITWFIKHESHFRNSNCVCKWKQL